MRLRGTDLPDNPACSRVYLDAGYPRCDGMTSGVQSEALIVAMFDRVPIAARKGKVGRVLTYQAAKPSSFERHCWVSKTRRSLRLVRRSNGRDAFQSSATEVLREASISSGSASACVFRVKLGRLVKVRHGFVHDALGLVGDAAVDQS